MKKIKGYNLKQKQTLTRDQIINETISSLFSSIDDINGRIGILMNNVESLLMLNNSLTDLLINKKIMTDNELKKYIEKNIKIFDLKRAELLKEYKKNESDQKENTLLNTDFNTLPS